MPKPETMLRARVRLVEGVESGNPQRCPIARSIVLSDKDVIYPHVTRDEIRFSRRSTGLHYTFRTPTAAREYVDRMDNQAHPGSFQLALTDRDLISTKPRTKRDPARLAKPATTKAASSKPRRSKSQRDVVPLS